MECARLNFAYRLVSVDELLGGVFMATGFDEPFVLEFRGGVEYVCGKPVDLVGSRKMFATRLRDLRKTNKDVPEFICVPEKKTSLSETMDKLLKESTKTIIFKGLRDNLNLVWCDKSTLCILGTCRNGQFSVKNGGRLRGFQRCEGNLRGFSVLTTSGIRHASGEERRMPMTSEKVARQIQSAMERGPHREDLLGKTIRIFKREQRRLEKKCLWSRVTPETSLLDLGSGRGADLSMWRERSLRVFAVEPNPKSFQILFKKSSGRFPFQAMRSGGESCEEIAKKAGKRDYVSMINSISFFFESERMLHNLSCTINECTRSGSVFFGSLMDSERVLKLVKPGNTYKRNAFSIEVFEEKGLTHKVRIHIDDAFSLVHDQTEYLSNFKMLRSHLKKIGFELVKTGFYSSSLVQPDQKWFTALTRWFVFRKA